MIRIRPYMDQDEERILTWCEDEETFYKWSFGVLGEYPLTSGKFAKTGREMRFTAFDEDGPAGFFFARNPGGNMDELRFGYVIVAPEKRGQGAGKEMLRQGLIYAFRIYKAKRVSLGVYKDNRQAYDCYAAVGFRETGKVENYTVCGRERVAVEMEVFPEPEMLPDTSGLHGAG